MPSRCSTDDFSYHPLDDEKSMLGEDYKHTPSRDSRFYRPTLFWSLCLLCTITASMLAGFFLGKLQRTKAPLTPSVWTQGSAGHPSEPDGMPFALKPVISTFRSNRTFLERPSEENDALWKTLYPQNHGVFEWPDDNHERAGFAGFHQLHCVDSLRKAWYIDQDIKTHLSLNKSISHLQPFEPDHVLHCVEFLRQSVMCHADTTIQTELSYHRGIVAFGVEYECRDWGQLVEWVDERNVRMFGSAESW